jgi:hypothetical protein
MARLIINYPIATLILAYGAIIAAICSLLVRYGVFDGF